MGRDMRQAAVPAPRRLDGQIVRELLRKGDCQTTCAATMRRPRSLPFYLPSRAFHRARLSAPFATLALCTYFA